MITPYRGRTARREPGSAVEHGFRFVAAVPGYHYRRGGADWILLFFEPVERLALLTFDWS
ncbi:hypothetical protein [Streptomyces sp. CBMA123]|uniref:hypothetical protein n=1 Tax=Streptomyces sp. CBMA123 TaxID=1896313 RepID=UPI001661BC24|nr:hypothetical protein [Streptomyces sp. CBMA123]MBD0690397.1 hypothetical protein [Streptomyces sp. CBMA123]